MSYEEMSDFEINQAVTCEVHGCQMWWVNKDGSFYHCGVIGDAYIHQPVVDYCNNPSDAWPIILANNISITKYEGLEEWDAHGGGICVDYDHCIISECGCFCSNKNPLRAAMIVFLMMQEKAQ